VTDRRCGPPRWVAGVAVVALLLVGLSCSRTTGRGEHAVTLDQGSSLTGTDSNGDGVRDDIARIIAGLAATPAMKQRLMGYARNQQRVMALDVSRQQAAQQAYEIATETNRIISCVPDDASFDEFDRRTDTLEAAIFDTDARRAQVDAFGELINGRDFPAPTC
jgi:hypothetical protein